MNLLWIIVAFLVGAVLAYWLCTRSREDEQATAQAFVAPSPPPAAPARAVESTPVHPDDLTKIEGIGPKIAEIMNGGGVMTFSQMAGTPVERLQEILDAEGERFRVHNPGSWPMQAGLAADGQWDELQELQDRLDGGKLE